MNLATCQAPGQVRTQVSRPQPGQFGYPQGRNRSAPSNETLGEYLDGLLLGATRNLRASTRRNYEDAFLPVRERLGGRRRVWVPALGKAGLSGIHFHDLRHTGNTLTAATGATLRELMDRMGHRSTRAALVYLHASNARQRAIADSLSRLAQNELQDQGERRRKRPREARTGTRRARKRGRAP